AIETVITNGKIGEVYNVGGNEEKQNIQVVHALCDILDELRPVEGKCRRDLITYVKDRPGHDQRYAIDSTKLQNELNWLPQESFETGIKKTVKWYLDNKLWCDRVLDGSYQGQRLGED
ncbi:MAG: GDP-mannose 4,6-dehydratase, partial [Marinicellaceae bacterium]